MRTPMCYGYGRHSTNKQSMTKEAQEAKVLDYCTRILLPQGVGYGGFFYDSARSGGQPMSEREQGRVLHLVAQPGDHIVVSKMDRAFRSLRDGVTSMEQWHDRGVQFHSLDLQIDTTTVVGKFFRNILLAVAELERGFVSERGADVREDRKKRGLPYSRGCPIGWRIIGESPHRQFKTDPAERAVCDHLAGLRSDGWSFADIADWSAKQHLLRSKRRFGTPGQARAAVNARSLGYPLINGYKKINELARGCRSRPA